MHSRKGIYIYIIKRREKGQIFKRTSGEKKDVDITTVPSRLQGGDRSGPRVLERRGQGEDEVQLPRLSPSEGHVPGPRVHQSF